MSSALLTRRCASAGFTADRRFGAAPALSPASEDPLARARAEGYAAGEAAARAVAEAETQAAEATRPRIELAFARLDAAQEEVLRRRLHETVAALCETALTPLALDPAALARRVERAAAMLSRADDERTVRLHPEDIGLLAGRLPEGWAIAPDPALERGALRIETPSGGIEDGPACWRRAIDEALGGC